MEDIAERNPPVFIDAVGHGNFLFQDRQWAHESFPMLFNWVNHRYVLIADLYGSRVYVRKDRLPGGPGH